MATASADPARKSHAGLASDGFYRIDGFADEAIGIGMLDEVTGIVRTQDPDTRRDALVLPEANLAGQDLPPELATSKVFRLHRRTVFRTFLTSPPVVAILREHLGDDVDCFLSQFIFKSPGAWGQPWHQDSYYFPFDPPRPVIGLWLAVTEATLANGCLHILAGSHRDPVHEHIPDRRPGANYGYVEIVDHDMSASEPVLMSPGDLLVFDSHLMHRSTDNESKGIRAAMVFHFAPAGTRDLTEHSFVNDWTPLVRGGTAVIAS